MPDSDSKIISHQVIEPNGSPQTVIAKTDGTQRVEQKITEVPDTNIDLLRAWTRPELWAHFEHRFPKPKKDGRVLEDASKTVWGVIALLVRDAFHHRKSRYMLTPKRSYEWWEAQTGMKRGDVWKAMQVLYALTLLADADSGHHYRCYLAPGIARPDDMDDGQQLALIDVGTPNNSDGEGAESFGMPASDSAPDVRHAGAGMPAPACQRRHAEQPPAPLRSAGARLNFSTPELRAEVELPSASANLDIDGGRAAAPHSTSALNAPGKMHNRKSAEGKWRLRTMDHWGKAGDGDRGQLAGDDTCSLQQFDQHIWPEGLLAEEGNRNLVDALALLDKAERKAKDWTLLQLKELGSPTMTRDQAASALKATGIDPFNVMSYITTCLRNRWAKRQGFERRTPPGTDDLRLMRSFASECRGKGWALTSEKAIAEAASRVAGWDRATYLHVLDVFEAAQGGALAVESAAR